MVPEGAEGTERSTDGRARLAAAVRRLTELTASARVGDEALEAAAADAQAVADALAAAAEPGRLTRGRPRPDGPSEDFFPTSPMVGRWNPLAPPVTLHVVDGAEGGVREIRADAWFGFAYEGPPTCVHGGVLAELFDEVLGAANIVAGKPGLTGTLSVKFRRPTPLRSHLRIEARFVGQEGRKIRSWAGIHHEGVLTAEASGVFIEVLPEQFLALAAANADSTGDRLADVIGLDAESLPDEVAERIGMQPSPD